MEQQSHNHPNEIKQAKCCKEDSLTNDKYQDEDYLTFHPHEAQKKCCEGGGLPPLKQHVIKHENVKAQNEYTKHVQAQKSQSECCGTSHPQAKKVKYADQGHKAYSTHPLGVGPQTLPPGLLGSGLVGAGYGQQGVFGAAQSQNKDSLLTQEQLALKGATDTIKQLMEKIESQKAEYERSLSEGFEEAYQLLLAERDKAANLEVELYKEYDKKLQDIKAYLVEKLDLFLRHKWEEFLKGGNTEVASKMEEFRKAHTTEELLEQAINFHGPVGVEKAEPKPVHVNELRLTFEMLERAMNLPPNVKIVAVQEEDTFKIFKIRLVSDKELQDSYSVPSLSTVGDLFKNPEKYKVAEKGSTRGA